MFHFNDKTLAGPGYITLNVIRVLNIICLLLVVVASWIMLVMTVKTSSFFFFDGVSHFITSSIGMFLIVSELMLFQDYFARCWPLLSVESGFVFLGSSMIVLGFNILGNLNKPATSVENLGLPFWRVVISSGILTAVVGVFNIIATIVFSDSKQGISGRQVRSHGATAPKELPFSKAYSLSSHGGSTKSRPSVQTSQPEERRRTKFGIKLPIRISGISRPVPADPEQFSKWETRSSPVAPEIRRPPTALHPFYSPDSRYSEAHNVDRF
ncbi:hypothetical protein PVAG01_01172 [Phlyctema vagabunda]|uniref:DUF7598 domain-containing protein n=1 Tax=Phlyctema vagabunda TaxID=108571 RepID=A0ABR4PWC4_9HELO